MFASDLDAASRQQLTRGARLMELLKQPQYSPYPVSEQVASIWAGTKGKLDKVAISDVRRFEQELLDHLRRNTDVLSTIESTGQLSDETEAALEKAVDEFAGMFQHGADAEVEGASLADGESADVEQEQIVTQKRG
jgi:F-type H+-transporting ATPase subunit alpha